MKYRGMAQAEMPLLRLVTDIDALSDEPGTTSARGIIRTNQFSTR